MVASKRRAVAVKRLTMYTEMGEEAVRKTMKVSLAVRFELSHPVLHTRVCDCTSLCHVSSLFTFTS